jgi:hypothetical protein
MRQLAFRTPPGFHVQPFVAEPTTAKHRRWVLHLGVGVLVAVLLGVGVVLSAMPAWRSVRTGIASALGDWIADLDEPELSQPSLAAFP